MHTEIRLEDADDQMFIVKEVGSAQWQNLLLHLFVWNYACAKSDNSSVVIQMVDCELYLHNLKN